MGVFNYSRFHYFDKDGNELILSHKPGVQIKIVNENIPDLYSEYALVKSTPDDVDIATNSSVIKIKSGMRFNIDEGSTLKAQTYIDSSTGEPYINDAFLREGTYKINTYTSTINNENYPELLYNEGNDELRSSTLDKNNLALDTSVNMFPSYTFQSRVEFTKVSTGLVETQALYVLVDDEYDLDEYGVSRFVTVSEYAKHYDEFLDIRSGYDSSINDITDRINILDSSISELETILEDKLTEIETLKQHIEISDSSLQGVTNEIRIKSEAYGIVDSELLAEKQQLEQEISNIDASINAIYESDSNRFATLDSYKELKRSLETDVINLENQRNEIQIKVDYFDSVKKYIDRFNVLFFIDCREQKDFRLFNVKHDDMTWTDRKLLDFSKNNEDGSNDNGFSVSLGFSGENDGVYEQTLYVCLIDKNDTSNNDIGEVYPIGDILMTAETEGEDERYRSFFENFGIPDPKYYNDIFADTDISNDTPDFISINKNSKKMFLAYSEIFPYIGSYKGLLNAIKLLGYENEIFFKEWYKEIGRSTLDDQGYTTYDISISDPTNKNLISNLEISERIHLRKMNWLSMVYKINELIGDTEDKWGFSDVITNYKNFNTDRIVKIIGLKNWLEKYAIGVNCHITDVGGEGIVLERYNLQKYGTYQRVLDYNNEKAVSAVVINDVVALNNQQASIDVSVYTTDKYITIEEVNNISFLDLCDGYFDDEHIYHDIMSNISDSSSYRYFGKCFDLNDNINTFEIRIKGKHNSFRFDSKYVDLYSPDLIVDDDRIFFDPYQCFTKEKNISFSNTPVIQVEKGIIKKYKKIQAKIPSNVQDIYDYYTSISPVFDDDGKSYKIDVNVDLLGNPSINVKKSYILPDIPTFIPPHSTVSTGYTHNLKPLSSQLYRIKTDNIVTKTNNKYGQNGGSTERNGNNYGLRYCIDDINENPVFKILGYEERHLLLNTDASTRFPLTEISEDSHDGYEYTLVIIDGRMIFNDTINNSIVTLNFKYDEDKKHQSIYVNTFKESEQSSMYKYKVSDNDTTERFLPDNEYSYFVNGYDKNTDDYITYDNLKSVIVNNTGDYVIDAVLYDEFNNIFAKKSTKEIKVLSTSIDSSILITEPNSGLPYNEKGKLANTSFMSQLFRQLNSKASECIFEYKPKLQINYNINGQIVHKGIYDPLNNINTIVNKTITKKAIISSMSDRFDVIGYQYLPIGTLTVDSRAFTLIKISEYGSHIGVYDASTLNAMFEYYGQTKSDIYTDLSYLYNVTTKQTTDSSIYREYGSFADVTLYVYDDVCEYPVMSIPGVMLPERLYYNNVKYDTYSFVPTTNKSLELSQKLQSICNNHRYSYYIIPQWAIPCIASKIYNKHFADRKDDTRLVLENIDNPFSEYTLSQSKVGESTMMSVFYKTKLSSQYYGKGSYRIESMNQDMSGMELCANLGNQRPTISNDQSGFDCSTWLAPASLDYMKYIFEINTDYSDNQLGVVAISDKYEYRDNILFVDNNYAISTRDFNPDDAIKIWEFDSSTYPSSSSLGRKYAHNIPITTSNPYVILTPYAPEFASTIAKVNSSNITVRWKIYRHLTDTSKVLISECFNKVMSIKFIEYGTYDIELTIWDEFGNRYDKRMDGYITYKK